MQSLFPVTESKLQTDGCLPISNRPFSSKGSQRLAIGWILICEGVDASVSRALSSRLTSYPTLKGGETMNKLYVGIDVACRDNTVCIMLPDGKKHSSFSVQNNVGGAKTLSQKVVAALNDKGLFAVALGIEATGVYGEHLINFLREDGALGKFVRELYVLNPKQVKKFKDAYSDLPKTDAVDAFIIADSLRFGRITKAVYEADYRYKALQTLTRSRFHVVQNLVREKQRFMNHLFMKCSGLAQEKIFSNTFGATSISIIDEIESVEELASMDTEQLTAFIIDKSKNHFVDPVCIAKSVKAAARGSYRLPKTVNHSVNQVLAVSVSLIRAFQAQIKTLDAQIAQLLNNIPQTLTSIPGIGTVLAAGIIAEIGDIKRFDNHPALAKYAGLTWRRHQSGNFDAQFTPMIRSGNRFLKYYLVEAAFSLVRCDTEFKRFYHLKYNEVNRFQHKRALALTARKFVRLVFSLLKDNRLYKPVLV